LFVGSPDLPSWSRGISKARSVEADDAILAREKVDKTAEHEILYHCAVAMQQHNRRRINIPPFEVVDAYPIALNKFCR